MSKVKSKMKLSEYVKHLEGSLKAQSEELKELRSELNDMINDDPNSEGTVNLEKLGFMDCGGSSWEYIDSNDLYETELWKNPKTGKTYEIRVETVRLTTEAKEVK